MKNQDLRSKSVFYPRRSESDRAAMRAGGTRLSVDRVEGKSQPPAKRDKEGLGYEAV